MEAKLQQQAPQKAQTNKPNLTGIPTQMKLDFEQRSGLSFDDVRVHYNSDKPAQLQALAYTQGTQVYVGPRQERHLPHELGHVVQQKSGIVHPTYYIRGIPINDQPQLEYSADQFSIQRMADFGTNAIIQMKKGKRSDQSSKIRRPNTQKRKGQNKGQKLKPKAQSNSQELNQKKALLAQAINEKLLTNWIRYGAGQGTTLHIIDQTAPKQGNLTITKKLLQIKLAKLGYVLSTDKIRTVNIYGKANYKDFRTKEVMRWLSSMIGTMVGTTEEVQCYCDNEEKQIIVGLNQVKAIDTAKEQLKTLTFKDFDASKIKYSKSSPVNEARFSRHQKKLNDSRDTEEIKRLCGSYSFVVAKVPARKDIADLLGKPLDDIIPFSALGTLHAEVKILWHIRINKKDPKITLNPEMIGGIRVMCAACQAITVDPSDLEKQSILSKLDYDSIIRNGPLWVTYASLYPFFLDQGHSNVLDLITKFLDSSNFDKNHPLYRLLTTKNTTLTLALTLRQTRTAKHDQTLTPEYEQTLTTDHDCDSEDDEDFASKMEE